MSTFAAVVTGKGTGAISTIQVSGKGAEKAIRSIFIPAGGKTPVFETGKILLGSICDDGEIIDHVVIGCEKKNTFAINCHGNPLIAAIIMRLLKRNGVRPASSKEILLHTLRGDNTIELEAKLVQRQAVTLAGAKLIARQADAGLSKKAATWAAKIKDAGLSDMKREAEKILQASRTAGILIKGCKVVLVGCPNSGKSTLLNALVGKQKSIVAEGMGTTRDYVTAQLRMGEVFCQLVDTAGISERPAVKAVDIDKLSQKAASQILQKADLVLLVLDNTKDADQLDKKLMAKLKGKKVLSVINKCDLKSTLDTGKLPSLATNSLQISAKFGQGIEKLREHIPNALLPEKLGTKTAVCITQRQTNLLKRLCSAKNKRQALSIITELLKGRVSV